MRQEDLANDREKHAGGHPSLRSTFGSIIYSRAALK